MVENVNLDRRARLSSKIASLLGLCLLAVCVAPSAVRAQANLVLNPGLSAGSGDSPQNWGHETYTLTTGDVTFDWLNDQQPPELEVWNYQPADSRWVQTVHLKPGWYHFTASVRTENVGEVDTGANISVMESWISSRDVRGTSYWEPVGFYLQVTKETDVRFALRLGFYSAQNTGRVYFRTPSVTQVSTPAADDPSFKLATWAQPAATGK